MYHCMRLVLIGIVGDIGPKFGFNSMDNGFLLFNKVKTPHISMLARFSRVDPTTDEYMHPPSASLVYGTMTLVRASIVKAAGNALARGVTIATRYSAVRRQFVDKDAPVSETVETPVLNYKMVEIRLLTNLAATFALHFTGKTMMQLYQKQHDSMNKNSGNTELSSNLLADLHATSCGLKALASSIAAEGLETCRRACGGHGYSNFSGIGPFYTEYLQNTTVEGDNYLLTQQVARYLLKSAEAVLKGAPATNDTTTILKQYLSRQDHGAAFDVLRNDADIVSAYAWRTSFLTFEALKQREEQKMGWNDLLVDFYRLSKAHSQYLVVKSFLSTLEDPETQAALDKSTLAVFRNLFRLYALHTLEQEGSEFFAASACSVQQLTLARTKSVMKLLKEVRPHAVRLVDSWDFPDYQLDSSLGRYDGKVYEDLFQRASERNPLNNLTIDPYPYSSTLIRVDKSKSKL
jgi:acyl-CoA oxidase